MASIPTGVKKNLFLAKQYDWFRADGREMLVLGIAFTVDAGIVFMLFYLLVGGDEAYDAKFVRS